MSLRPSNLPKLAVCACYQAAADAGPAAERGTALDALFRSRLKGDPEQREMFYQPTPADFEAIGWAVLMVGTLAGGSPVISTEEECRVSVPGIEKPGTADAIFPEKCAHADLKTGQKRNYREQMAAYALGLMEQHFASEWTAHLLFCDQREVVSIRFTYQEAREIVAEVVARFNDPEKRPVVCEYCGWCAQAESCPARLEVAQTALAIASPGFDFAEVLADNDKLGRFLTACAVLEDFREQAATIAKQRLESGASIIGWKLPPRRSPEFVQHDAVGRYIQQLGFGAVLAAYGNISAKKFREVWELKMSGEKPFPEEIVQHGKSSVALVPARATAKPQKTTE